MLRYGDGSGDFVRRIGYMIHDEASLQAGVRMLQEHCLAGGLSVKFPGNVPPTPSFARHLKRYFVPFCRDAIEAFLSVGFAPYRIRPLEDGGHVPELLPLGTYTWSVTRNQNTLPRAWLAPRAKDKEEEEACYGPLLRYDVTTTYTDKPAFVYPFCTPSPLFVCCSPMAALVEPYVMLLNKRQCTLRADAYNSKPGIVFEQADKASINKVTETGRMVIQDSKEMQGVQKSEKDRMASHQQMQYEVLASCRNRSNLPEETVTVMAPLNHAVHGLDKALTPQDLHREELGFIRLVAVTLGLPPVILLQASAVIGTAAVSTSSSTQGWADSSESCNRQMLQTCHFITEHLQNLMYDVYRACYPSSKVVPEFQFCPVPTISLEHIMAVYDAKIFDDHVMSSMLKVETSFFPICVYMTWLICRPPGGPSWATPPRRPGTKSGRPNSSCLSKKTLLGLLPKSRNKTTTKYFCLILRKKTILFWKINTPICSSQQQDSDVEKNETTAEEEEGLPRKEGAFDCVLVPRRGPPRLGRGNRKAVCV